MKKNLTFGDKILLACCTTMRFYAEMSSFVHCELVALPEGCITHITDMFLLFGVPSSVIGECARLVESLLTNLTSVRRNCEVKHGSRRMKIP